MLGLLITTLLLAPPTTPAPLPRKGTLWLEDAVDLSTFICVGTVEDDVRVARPADWIENRLGQAPADLAFGRIRVERVLLGEPSTKVVWHEAWCSWQCDSTSSFAGKRALFFLRPGATGAQSESTRVEVVRVLGTGDVLVNVGSGDGLVAIRAQDDGLETVQFFGAPSALDVPPRDALLPAGRGGGRQSLAAITAWIEEGARFRLDSCAIWMHSDRGRDHEGAAFDARYLPDGEFRLAVGRGHEQLVRLGRVDPRGWERLRADLESVSGASPIEFVGREEWERGRTLSIRLGSALHTWWLPEIAAGFPNEGPTSRADLRAGLTAWTLVRGAIDCTECADHRAADERAFAR